MRCGKLFVHITIILLAIVSVGYAFEVTVLNDWTCDWAPQILGLDILEEYQGYVAVAFISDSTGYFDSLDPSTGLSGGGGPLSPDMNNVYGVAYNDDPEQQVWFISDTGDGMLYRTDDGFGTWTTRLDPSGGGGMAHHEGLFWVTGVFGVWYFTDDGGRPVCVDFAAGPSFPTGIAVFRSPSQTDCAILAGEYSFELYDISSAGPEFPIPIGHGDFPFSVHRSCGVAYSSNLYTFFWGYELTPGDYRIAELDFDLGLALEGSTWGGLKAVFR